VPGLQAFLNAFSEERAWGDEGYLLDKGLIPLPQTIRADEGVRIRRLDVMTERPS
jgi:phosphate transport system substrate-binding protein